MQFAFKDKVIVREGFYKGFQGVITSYKENKGDFLYNVSLVIDRTTNKKIDVSFKEHELRKTKVIKMLGFTVLEY